MSRLFRLVSVTGRFRGRVWSLPRAAYRRHVAV